MFRTLIALIALAPSLAVAQDPQGKFALEGTALRYDTEQADDLDVREISNDDVDTLLAILRGNPEITSLTMNSTGGSVWAGDEMARIVIDFELDTIVDGECSSSCVSIFLGGTNRTMTRGSKVGFHQRSWPPSAIQGYYERNRDREGWDSAYHFASWSYRDTQTEVHRELTYMIERGVDAAFAVETKRATDSVWFPNRARLIEVGILTQ